MPFLKFLNRSSPAGNEYLICLDASFHDRFLSIHNEAAHGEHQRKCVENWFKPIGSESYFRSVPHLDFGSEASDSVRFLKRANSLHERVREISIFKNIQPIGAALAVS